MDMRVVDNNFKMKWFVLAALLALLVVSEVIPFNNDAIEKIFKESNDALFLFIGDEEAQAASLQTFKDYDATNPGLIVSISSKNDGHGLFDRLAEYLGVDTSVTPQVLYLNAKQAKFIYDATEISLDNLISFVSRVQSGEVEAFLKSAPIPASNDEPVKVIVGKQWNEWVVDS